MAKDLHSFLADYEASHPEDVIHVSRKVNGDQEITAIIVQLEKRGKFPLLVFHKVTNGQGKIARQPVVTNVLASRVRYARICNSTIETLGRDVYRATRQERRKPVVISRSEAPVKEVVKTGSGINLLDFPILVHNAMDAGRYFSAGSLITYDPDSRLDNCALARGWAYDRDTIRTMVLARPMHNGWNLHKHDMKNQDMKVAYWLGHHPLAYIGSLAKLPYPSSHWESMGGMLGEPLRVVPSESLGDDFLVPADAEVIVEGIVEANKRYAEGPFGEFPGYYGAQILSPQWKVTAITHRKNAIWYDIAAAHMDHPGTGAPPLEGMLWEMLKARFPSLTGVYMPTSGVGRYHAYLQFKNPAPGDARQAIMMAASIRGMEIKHVFAFDDDVDIFNPNDVMWAIATRTQWSDDVMVFPHTKSVDLDPSTGPGAIGDMGGIDCTKPWGEHFEERVGVDREVMEKIKLEDFIPPQTLA